MEAIYCLKNTIQNYGWGSKTAIAKLLGNPWPCAKPQAELWMGAHPKAPSIVRHQGSSISLVQLTVMHPEDLLGSYAAREFNQSFPFLFKVLAAQKPLSVQAHPDKKQAKAGFLNEEKQNIPIDAENRNYKDENHKPECICALTPFTALNGFRHIPDMIHLLEEICPGTLSAAFQDFKQHPNPDGLRLFYKTLMSTPRDARKAIARQTIENAKNAKNRTGEEAFDWIVKLGMYYPDDIGVLSPVLLNLIRLEPGQAMFLHAGVLHSYLNGLGIELMANSDNVLRGGLTGKHVDEKQLVDVVHFTTGLPEILGPEPVREFETQYKSDAVEFALSRIEPGKDEIYKAPEKRGVEILLCVDGQGSISIDALDFTQTLAKGDSILIPASSRGYHIKGPVKIYKAAVPMTDA